MSEEKKDVIIVGGGVGGVAVGAMLAHDGFKVKLFEKNKLIGGRCLTYDYKGFKVDLGVHLFGVGPKGYLGDVCDRIEMPDAIEWVISKNPRPTMYFSGELQVYSRKNMSKVVGASEEEFNLTMKFFADVLSMRKKKMKELYYTGLTDFINTYSKNPTLHTFISMIAGQYFCTYPDETSAGELIRCFRQVVNAKSSAYPVGACIAIPKAYQKGIEIYGGEVKLNTPVKTIIVEDNKAKGVELEDGTEHYADIIISNADIQNTVLRLTGKKYFPKDYVNRVKDLKYANHCLALKVGLKKPITDQKLVMAASGLDYNRIKRMESELQGGKVPDKVGGMVTIPTNYDAGLAPDGKQMIFFGTGCLGEKSKSYYDKIGEKCWEMLNEIFPKVEKNLLWKKLDTPKLVEAYAGEYGNIIGVAQTVDQIHERRPKHQTPIEGLYIVGAEAGGHGIGAELAANSAMELHDILMKK
ncbi:MAG: NAD(P)-binding protein [Candidatus Lokiarchaeota archaeon]|nr:NAD(P)-binding protein [Candidatus Lokiarchaeota archaeon]